MAAIQFVVNESQPASSYILPTQQAAVATYLLLGGWMGGRVGESVSSSCASCVQMPVCHLLSQRHCFMFCAAKKP